LDRRVTADIIQWDIATWRPALDFWLERTGSLAGSLALELGARDGGLSLFLARAGCRVICSDVNGPTEQAKRLHSDYGVQDAISYEVVDMRRIPHLDDCFDVVILKSTLGALGNADARLGPQSDAVTEIHRVLRPGGVFLFAENMAGSTAHAWLRKHFVPWGREWLYFTDTQLGQLLSGFRKVDLRFCGFASAFGRREWQRTLLHGLDRLLVPLLPESARYVVFGCAQK
jgi:SAM-dependent methyltransferase